MTASNPLESQKSQGSISAVAFTALKRLGSIKLQEWRNGEVKIVDSKAKSFEDSLHFYRSNLTDMMSSIALQVQEQHCGFENSGYFNQSFI
jgi:hypothetical protein